MKRKGILCAFLVLTIFAAMINTKSSSAAKKNLTVYAMDTVMYLTAYGENAESALRLCEEEIFRLDSLFRRGSEQSEVGKINASGEASVCADTAKIVSEALEIAESTGGAFDITVAPVMDLWGFYGGNFRVPADDEISAELERVGYEKISVSENTVSAQSGAQIDLGGIAKGYCADKIIEILKECNVRSAVISLGGNVHTLGLKSNGEKWRVGIQNPDGDSYIGTVEISDMAAVTSGGYQRYFEQDGIVYHHIIDPKTGKSAQSGVKSVTVFSPSGALADGLSTALFVMGIDKGLEYWRTHSGFEVIFVSDDDKIYVSSGIAGQFECEREYETVA